MLKTAKLLNLVCAIVLLRYDLINFNFEKDLSADADVTGNVKYNSKAVQRSGKLLARELASQRTIVNQKKFSHIVNRRYILFLEFM